MTVRDSSGNPFIDYVWGNVPMQPNDDRGEATLDPALDNHIIATSGYQGFPEFIRGGIYDDVIPNVTVPNVVGMLSATAKTTLNVNGFDWSETTTTSGATSQNNGKIKSQSPVAGTVANSGGTVAIVKYNYVAPANSGPIASIVYDAALPAGDYKMYLLGQVLKPSVNDTINVTGNGNSFLNVNGWTVVSVENDNAYNTGGTKVIIRKSGVVTTNTGVGGTWTKV